MRIPGCWTCDLDAAEHRCTPRPWVVERTLAWLQKCRAILIRHDKNAESYRGLIQLACARLWYRRRHGLKTRQRVSREFLSP